MMAKRKTTVFEDIPEHLFIVDADKLPDLKPTDVIVFSIRDPFPNHEWPKLRSHLDALLANNGIENKYIILGPALSLHVLRVEP
jgi:hypothetical protein